MPETEKIRQIAARALFLDERIERQSEITTDKPKNGSINERLSKWKKNAAKDNDNAFSQWLSWRELDEETAKPCLATPVDITLDDLPRWALFLQRVLQSYNKNTDEELYPKDNPIPFEEIFTPFAREVKAKLLDNLSKQTMALVSDQLLTDILRELVANLSHKSAGVFHHRFQQFRQQRHPELMIGALTGLSDSNQKKARKSTQDFDAFIHKLKEGAIVEVMEEYSAAARILASSCLQWVDMMTEFFRRLHEDLPQLGRTFFDGAHPGKLTDIAADFSDPHQNGRCVMQLRFASGHRLVYKPHDLQIDTAYAQLLEWLNARSKLDYFKPIKTLPREGYGWVAFIEQQPCDNEAEADCYFQRAGGLLALSYILKSADLHKENLIAHGGYPIIVDMETIIQAVLPSYFSNIEQENQQSEGHAFSALNYSVLRTGLLPSWHHVPGGDAIDISGLESDSGSTTEQRQWAYVNTDGMAMESRETKLEENQNAAYLGDTRLNAVDYIDNITAGFQAIYQLIMKHRQEWQTPDGPLAAFAKLPLRFLYRNSDLYGAILNRSIQPPALSEGIDRSLQIEMLSRPYLFLSSSNGKPQTWPMFEQERRAIERLDIPMFTVYADSTDLLANADTPIEDFFEQSAVGAIREHLSKLSNADMNLQCRLIRSSFTSKNPPEVKTILREASPVTVPDEIPSSDQFLDEASRLGQEILDASILFEGNQREWLTLKVNPHTEKLTPSLAMFDLYNGKTGILFALATVADATNDDAMKEQVRRSTHQLCNLLDNISQMPTGNPIGGFSGAGAIIYGLLHLSQLTDSSRALETAQYVTSWITPSKIHADTMLDVMGGSAGALLSLLALYEYTGDEQYLDKSTLAGNHLLKSRIKDEPTGCKAWPFPHQTARPLTGFSHGAAGIAYSLLQLDDQLNGSGEKFRKAALEALKYERAVFDEQQCNWPDFRSAAGKPKENPACMTAWCHGAPGIGLSRVLMRPYLSDDTMLNREITAAVQTTANHPLDTQDHLCCGNFGRIAILHTMGQATGNSEWIDAAKRKTAGCMNRAQKDGQYLFAIPQKGDCPNVSLFRGIGGVAYTLVQLARPGNYPSLLAMETPS
jgi:type 2 lantibiotic biosynthesis protein LanM